MSKEKDNPYVTVGTCKIVTDALNAKIEAQSLLFQAELKGFKNIVYASVTTLGIAVGLFELFLKFWRP
jgi:hypothetical protein